MASLLRRANGPYDGIAQVGERHRGGIAQGPETPLPLFLTLRVVGILVEEGRYLFVPRAYGMFEHGQYRFTQVL